MKSSAFFSKKDILSVSSTALIWLVFLVLSLVIQPEKETRYEVIQLVFEEEKKAEVIPEPVIKPVIEEKPAEIPVKQEIKEISAEIKEEAKKTDPAVQEKKTPVKDAVSVPKQSGTPKNTTPAAQVQAEKKVEPKLVQSMDELMAQNNKAVKKEAVWDQSAFDSSAVEQESQSVPQIKESADKPVAALEGTAASAQKDSASSAAAQTSKTSSSSSVLNNTESALANISSAKPGTYTASESTQGISFETQSSSKTEGGGVSMDLSDGSSRKLIKPSKPAIILSAESEKLITSSITVTIIFSVLANGTVPVGSISFQPVGIIPVSVQTEIRSQIAQWRFEEEKSDGQARLTYSINVK